MPRCLDVLPFGEFDSSPLLMGRHVARLHGIRQISGSSKTFPFLTSLRDLAVYPNGWLELRPAPQSSNRKSLTLLRHQLSPFAGFLLGNSSCWNKGCCGGWSLLHSLEFLSFLVCGLLQLIQRIQQIWWIRFTLKFFLPFLQQLNRLNLFIPKLLQLLQLLYLLQVLQVLRILNLLGFLQVQIFQTLEFRITDLHTFTPPRLSLRNCFLHEALGIDVSINLTSQKILLNASNPSFDSPSKPSRLGPQGQVTFDVTVALLNLELIVDDQCLTPGPRFQEVSISEQAGFRRLGHLLRLLFDNLFCFDGGNHLHLGPLPV
mmetsp:Transcript_37612/g.59420  ORF Transcript_37612/g.59420 Transcript_37612/m.59420 type:complete len:317 (+) Transcript_37612:423-1373(+)